MFCLSSLQGHSRVDMFPQLPFPGKQGHMSRPTSMCTNPSSKNDSPQCICYLPHSDFTATWEPQPTSLLLPAGPLWRCVITVPKSRSSKSSDSPAWQLLQAELQLPWHLPGTVFMPQSFPQKGNPWALSSPLTISLNVTVSSAHLHLSGKAHHTCMTRSQAVWVGFSCATRRTRAGRDGVPRALLSRLS